MNFFSQISPHQAIIPACLVMLSACGGGGSTNVPPAPINSTINSSNQISVATQNLNGVLVLNGQVQGLNPIANSTVPVAKPNFDQVVGSHVANVMHSLDVMANSIFSKTVNCASGGNLQVTYSLASNTGLSNGDSITILANSCLENGALTNGSLTIAFANVSGSMQFGSWSATMNVTLNNVSVKVGANNPIVKNGDMSLKFAHGSVDSFNVSGQQFSVSYGDTKTSLNNYSYKGESTNVQNSFSMNFNHVVATSQSSSSYTVATLTQFVQPRTATYPTSGVMTITASDKSSMKITILDANSLQIQIDPNGSGVYGTPTVVTWNSLRG